MVTRARALSIRPHVLERYLQLCAENNLQVCYPTTPAQYFHLLRRQVKQEIIRPLIVMTPKSLLRLPAASSTMSELTTGGFQPVIDDQAITDKSAVKRVVVCSGKVFYDLEAGREDARDGRVAIVRLEQFYPFPAEKLKEIFASYTNAKQILWTQEEPQNMGGWTFVEQRIREVLPEGRSLRYVGRAASASPATGSYKIHELEQKQIVDRSLAQTRTRYLQPASRKFQNASPRPAPKSSNQPRTKHPSNGCFRFEKEL
jgi:2-oxoglutarate dehydrogenase E1 component